MNKISKDNQEGRKRPKYLVGTKGVGDHGSDGYMSHETDGSQSLASEAKGLNRTKVLELRQLRGGEAFTNDGKVLFLRKVKTRDRG